MFNCIKNHYEREIKFKKATFYKSQLDKNQTYIQSVWKTLNSFIGKCISQHSTIVHDPLTNDVIKEPFEIVEAFNNYFIDIQKKSCNTNDFLVKHKSDKIDSAQLLQSTKLIHFF